jgi:hypothetical protein
MKPSLVTNLIIYGTTWIAWFFLVFGALTVRASLSGFSLGDAANYAVLYEGNNGHNLQMNSAGNFGNIGIAGTGHAQLNNPATFDGSVNFAAANTGQYSYNATGVTSVNYGVTQVQTDMNAMNALSASLSLEASASQTLAINTHATGSQTINVSAGTTDASGNKVFNVTSMDFENGETLTINGDGTHNVVFDINFSTHFAGHIVLTGGLTSDNVLFNLTGGSGLMNGDTLQSAANGAVLYGDFLDPNGTIDLNSVVLDGRVFGGDSTDMQIVSNGSVVAPLTPPSVPEPSTILAGALLLLPLGASTVRILRKNRTVSV